MKYLLTTLILISLYHPNLQAQCIADAGPDKIVCNFLGVSNDQIGGNPSATGTPPFTYAWETEYQVTFGSNTYTYYASNFLDDTTLANPMFINVIGDSLYFILTVTDNNNYICKDTVFIRISYFDSHLTYWTAYVQLGDSLFLNQQPNIGGGIPPVQYLWQPTHGLSDSTNIAFWVKPDTSINYSLTITDSAGCTATGSPFYYINVLPVSVEEINKFYIDIYPNPTTDFIIIRKNKNDKLTLNLYNIEGKLIREFSLDKGLEAIRLTPELDSGFYFYKIEDDKGINLSGKLIKL